MGFELSKVLDTIHFCDYFMSVCIVIGLMVVSDLSQNAQPSYSVSCVIKGVGLNRYAVRSIVCKLRLRSKWSQILAEKLQMKCKANLFLEFLLFIASNSDGQFYYW
jgi:hypothetical protein